MKKILNWGFLSTAKINRALIKPLRASKQSRLLAVASRSASTAEAYAREWDIPRAHGSYEALLADPDIDIIYNSLPNHLHAEWTIKALQAGKHVLCEKPFSSNAKEAVEMAEAAKESGKILSEAFAYRYHPLTARVKEIISNGELGAIKHIEAQFCFLLPVPSNIRFRYDLAGGSLMDAGCYPVSLVRYLMGEEPEVVGAKAKEYKPDVDSRMEAELKFPNGARGHIVCDMLSPRLFHSSLHVQGDAGEVKVFSPFQPHVIHRLNVRTNKTKWSGTVNGGNIYTLQLRAFAQAILSGAPLNTTPEDAVQNMRVIDAIYEKAGLPLR